VTRHSKKKRSASLDSHDDARRLPVPVVAVLAAAFLNLLGFTMATPLNPTLAAHFQLAGPALGSLTSAYPLGMLFGLLVWPSMSDARGMRKPILVASLAGSGFGLSLQATCLSLRWPLWAFLSLRTLSGLFAGASPVAKAFLSDIAADKDDLPRFLAYREASATLAFIVGPFCGGVLYSLTQSLAAVVAATAFASLLAAATVAAATCRTTTTRAANENDDDDDLLSNTRRDSSSAGTLDAPAAQRRLVAQSLEMPSQCPLGTRLVAAVATIVLISSLENAGSATWDAFGAVVAADRFGWPAHTVGALLTAGACGSFAVSTALFGRILRRVGIVPTAVLGLAFVGLGLCGVGLFSGSHAGLFLAAAALYQLGRPLYSPTLPTLLLRCVPPARRGFAMGVDSAFNTAARAVAPVALGFVLHAHGPPACFLCAGSLVLAAALVAALRGVQVVHARRRVLPPTSVVVVAARGRTPAAVRALPSS